jgi:hypothetical protein
LDAAKGKERKGVKRGVWVEIRSLKITKLWERD